MPFSSVAVSIETAAELQRMLNRNCSKFLLANNTFSAAIFHFDACKIRAFFHACVCFLVALV